MSNPDPYNALITNINTKLGNLHKMKITSNNAASLAIANAEAAKTAANAEARARAEAAKTAAYDAKPFFNVRTGGRRTKRHTKKHRKSKQSRRALRSSKSRKAYRGGDATINSSHVISPGLVKQCQKWTKNGVVESFESCMGPQWEH